MGKYIKKLSPNKYTTLSFLILSIALYLLFILLLSVDKGLDITDDSFYIIHAGYHKLYLNGMSDFGIYTGILYNLADNNIAMFRLIGMLLLTAVSLFSSWEFVKYFESRFDRVSYGRFGKAVYSLVLTAGVLSYYYMYWLTTPSYNWMLLTGSMMIFGAIFLFYNKTVNNMQMKFLDIITPSLLIGLGGFLLVNSNPLAAFAIGIITLLFIIASNSKIKDKLLFTAFSSTIAIVLLYLHIIYVSGNISAHIENIKLSLELSAAMGGGHTISEVLVKSGKSVISVFNPVGFAKNNYLYVLSAVFLFFLSKILFQRRIIKNESYILLIDLTILIIMSAYILGNFSNNGLYGFEMVHLILLLLLLYVLKIFFTSTKSEFFEKEFNRGIYILLILIFLIPIFLRFGTANELISASFAGAYFYFIIIFIMSAHIYPYARKIYRYFVLLLMLSLLLKIQFNGYNDPYRLITPLNQQTHKIKILGNPSVLYVDEITKKWVEGLQFGAMENGWESGYYLLDFTGGTPGAAVILNAKAPGRAWLLGGYPGSDEFVYRALSMVDKNIINEAWILTTPEGIRKISDIVMQKLDIDLNNYKRVTEVKTAHRDEHQILWKPVGR